MRIRKNAKLSSTVIFPEGSRPETVHVCELNQSPWDVIPFCSTTQEPYPSSSLLNNQFQAQDSFNGNGSLGDSIGAVESVTSILDSEEKAITNVEEGMVIVDDNDDNDEPKRAEKSQCEEEDRKEKESALLKSCNSGNGIPSSLTSSKKFDKNNQLTVGSRRGRARTSKKGSSSSASNPYEFYYYSGFGPLWGKRRGGSGSEISRNIIEEGKEVENCSAITTQNNTTPSSSSQINGNEEFDYVDDDFDDDEEEEDDENGDSSGKKRMRKPIKARSLKSLM